MKIKILFIIVLISNIAVGQTNTFSDPDVILAGQKKQPKVLLVGSWHFNYPGLDAFKSDEKNKINIYSPERQKELKELLDYIAKFNPTKIVVESGRNTGYLMYNYRAWKQGKAELYANERSQIGIRLMDQFKLDTVYGVDAYPLLLELQDKRDSTAPKNYLDVITERHYFGGKDTIQQRYRQFYSYEDSMKLKNTLLESFKYINSEKVSDRMFGAYIEGGQFDSNNFEGADALSTLWIDRNVRIFRNIQKIGFTENDRILIIFGSGHIPLLKFFFKSSPNYEVVDFLMLQK
ncbi:DUF5694 domain-containing protein [Chitinophagaceae bacterium LWZ2-11]